MFVSASKILALALAVAPCHGFTQPAFMRHGRQLVGCDEQCTETGGCNGDGIIAVCHEGTENECLESSEWNEHCTEHGDTCGPCANGNNNGGGCFSSTSTLVVRGKGPVAMEDAQIGDMVLTSTGKYEPLYAFGHFKPDKNAEFLKIKTTVDTLEVTGEHLLHVVGKENPVRADSVNVGDSLVSTEGTARVVKTNTVTAKGLYAPLTPSGKIVVNNIVASSYIALTDTEEHLVVGPWSMAHSDFVHLTLAPFRVFCMSATDKPCRVYNEEGIAVYVRWGWNIVEAADQGAFWGYLGLAIGMPIATAFLAVESVFGPSYALLAVFALGLGFSYWRKSAAGKVKTV